MAGYCTEVEEMCIANRVPNKLRDMGGPVLPPALQLVAVTFPSSSPWMTALEHGEFTPHALCIDG